MSNIASLKPFKKGEKDPRRNITGLNKGSVSWKTRYLKEMARLIKVGTEEGQKQITVAEGIARKHAQLALKGDLRAAELIQDRTEGRSPEKIQVEQVKKLINFDE